MVRFASNAIHLSAKKFETTNTIFKKRSLIGQAPIAVLCLALAHWQLPVSPRHLDSKSDLSLWKFDYLGLGAFFISVSLFILGTTDGGMLFNFNTPAMLAASGAFLVVFMLIERFGTVNPIIPPTVVSAPGLGAIFLGQVIFFANISTVSMHPFD
jgi:hypothetical protein